jgi:peptidoglycan/LPS O-acetylase OafA/YrhL
LRRPEANVPALDGMRAIASIMLLAFHAALLTGLFSPASEDYEHTAGVRALMGGCWGGVDVYFVLSGFLIGRILMSELRRDGTIHLLAFFVRRTCRVFPAYYLILIGSLLLSRLEVPALGLLYGTLDADLLWRMSWTNFLYVVNYVNPPPDGASIMSWAWSLSVEEHMYALLPPLLLLVFRLPSAGGRLAGLVACTLLPLAGRAAQYVSDPSTQLLDVYYASHTRFDEILIGVLLGHLFVERHETLRRVALRLGHGAWIAGFALIACAWTFGGVHSDGMFVVVWQFTVLATGIALLLLNGIFLDNWLTRFLSGRYWYPLARVSYGNYLIHPFVVIVVARLFWPEAGAQALGAGALLALIVIVMAITTVLAAVMFLAVEAPILAWSASKRPPRRPTTTRPDGPASGSRRD